MSRRIVEELSDDTQGNLSKATITLRWCGKNQGTFKVKGTGKLLTLDEKPLKEILRTGDKVLARDPKTKGKAFFEAQVLGDDDKDETNGEESSERSIRDIRNANGLEMVAPTKETEILSSLHPLQLHHLEIKEGLKDIKILLSEYLAGNSTLVRANGEGVNLSPLDPFAILSCEEYLTQAKAKSPREATALIFKALVPDLIGKKGKDIPQSLKDGIAGLSEGEEKENSFL